MFFQSEAPCGDKFREPIGYPMKYPRRSVMTLHLSGGSTRDHPIYGKSYGTSSLMVHGASHGIRSLARKRCGGNLRGRVHRPPYGHTTENPKTLCLETIGARPRFRWQSSSRGQANLTSKESARQGGGVDQHYASTTCPRAAIEQERHRCMDLKKQWRGD